MKRNMEIDGENYYYCDDVHPIDSDYCYHDIDAVREGEYELKRWRETGERDWRKW